jgi:hypothetical protein
MKYITVEDNFLGGLERQVNSLLSEGWKLYGNLCVIYIPTSQWISGDYFIYTQALTKEE